MRNARPLARVLGAASLMAVTALAGCAQETNDPVAEPSAGADPCADVSTKQDGMVTVATSDPAFPPYVLKNNPTSGDGFESATAYAVAAEMGFAAADVKWTYAPFNKLFAPGEKDFDFALNQISITPERQNAVTFSEPYYEVANAVLVLKDSEFEQTSSLADLQDAKIGVQVNTTALPQVEAQIAPTQDVSVFDDSSAATQALKNGQIDAFVSDLPTTVYLAAVEVPGTVVGQFPPDEEADTWGLVLEKDSALVTCVNQAVTSLNDSGQLQKITDEWMTDYTDAPVLR